MSAAEATTPKRGRRQWALISVCLLVVGVSAWRAPGFFTASNVPLLGLAFGHQIWLALGMTLVILAAGIDLSVGSNVALSAIILGLTYERTGSILLAGGAALAAGALAGALNGALIAGGRIPALIVTLATLAVFRGAAFFLAGERSFRDFPPAFTGPAESTVLGLPPTAWLAFAGIVVFALFASRTRWGRELYALGANPAAARLSGVNVQGWRFWLYVFSGATAGLTAVLYAMRFGAVQADIGRFYELSAITAVVLGGTSIMGGEGDVRNTALALATLVALRSALYLTGMPPERQQVAVAALLILAIWFDTRSRSRADSA